MKLISANQIVVPSMGGYEGEALRCEGCGAVLRIRNFGHDGDSPNEQHTVLDCLQHLASLSGGAPHGQ